MGGKIAREWTYMFISAIIIGHICKIYGGNIMPDDDDDHDHDDDDGTLKVFDGSILDDVQEDSTHAELSKMMMLDNQLMRDMYLTSTDKVFSKNDIQQMISAVASKPSLKLSDAVTTIVNLKLIQRLQFRILDSLFLPCSDLDQHQRVDVAVSETRDSSKTMVSGKNQANIENREPACLSRLDNEHLLPTNCSRESCRFYLHCVLHKRQCSENILELASNYLLHNKSRLAFATGDKQTDRLLAKSFALSQFANPEQAIAYVTELIEEEGENVGLLHSRVLAYARSGITEAVVELIVKDVNLALSLDAANEHSIYRKAAVLLAVAQYFDALETLELGLTFYPNNPEFHEMKGSCHFQLQELAQAEECFRNALELDVENKHGVLQKLGLVLYRQGKLAKAVSVYKELMEISPSDSNTLISIAHCYRQQGEGRKALRFADKAVKMEEQGKIQLLFRGSLNHALGNDQRALEDFQLCLKYHATHELCMYHAALSYATLGQFYDAVKSLVGVTHGMDPTSPSLQPNSHYIKASYLINYYRYLHSKLELPPSHLRLDDDLRPAFKDGWAKGTPLDLSEYFASEQQTLSPDIPEVQSPMFSSYDSDTQRLICRAQHYGRLMQVKADSFLPNQRFNLAMGLAAIHIGQHLRKTWITSKKSGLKKLTWKQLYEMTLPYRRLADLEVPILWLSMIYREEHIGYHNEVSFYRSQVKNLRMKPYFDLVFGLTRSMLKQQMSMQYPEHTNRQADIEIAKTPEDLVSIAKAHIPAQITTTVPSSTNQNIHFDGGMIVLAHTGFGGASLYMNIPTTHIKTQDYDHELSLLYNKAISQASKLKTNTLDADATVNAMMTMTYYFFNLCPLSRGSASVGLSALLGMFLSIDKEMSVPLPEGKMLDMEATLSGGPDEFIFGTKDWFKLSSMKYPITSLPLVADSFPTVRALMELFSVAENTDCPTG